MFRTLLKSKIHRASVTHGELAYGGSCAMDEDLLAAANIGERPNYIKEDRSTIGVCMACAP